MGIKNAMQFMQEQINSCDNDERGTKKAIINVFNGTSQIKSAIQEKEIKEQEKNNKEKYEITQFNLSEVESLVYRKNKNDRER